MLTFTRRNTETEIEILLENYVIHRIPWTDWRSLREKYPKVQYEGDCVLIDAIKKGLQNYLGPDQLQPFTLWLEEAQKGTPPKERTYDFKGCGVSVPPDGEQLPKDKERRIEIQYALVYQKT